MPYCPNCGGENPEIASFCGLCGAALYAAPPLGPPQPPPPPAHAAVGAPSQAATSARPAGILHWTTSFALATNRFVLYDMAKVFFWTGLILSLIGVPIALANGAGRASLEEWVNVLGMFTLILCAMVLLFVLIMVVFFGNRFRAWFYLGPQGMAYETRSRRATWSNRAAIVAGILGASAGAVGAGLIASSQEEMFTPWCEVKRVKVHPRFCVISVMNGWRVLFRLYCTPANYEEAERLVRHYAAGAAVTGGLA
ncbi:MAG: zinc ribbon domain-containing protein [Acidobacteria bacterium]|nr:zinc ribbon domain-containing protein [Acidobacteriota bacterium]